MHYLRTLALCLALCACAGSAYKVLVVFPFPGQSHGILGDGVVRHLLNAGHEVTYVTPFVKEKAHPKLRQIDVSVNQTKPEVSIKAIMDKEEDMFDLGKFFNMTIELFRSTFTNTGVQRLMTDPKESFDLVIAEWMFVELYSGFANVFSCPFIWVSTVEPHSSVLKLIDESLNPSYTTGLLSTITPPFTFVERVKELFMYLASTAGKTFYFDGLERAEFDVTFGPILRKKGLPVPNFEDVRYNVSLILGNSHVSLGQAIRLPQNYIPVAGYHINTDIKPLPADLQKLMDSAKHGVIYFSLGSNLKSKELPNELKRDLLKMFGTLKQTVLWKFEETLPNLPSNVHILKWAPQTSILSHSNLVLFITHGGLLSSTETIFFGKPTVGIPVFADQFANVERAEKKGFGKRVDLSYTMAAELKVAIDEVLGNPRYAKKAKELSFIHHHRPVPPGTELVHWVEHVIKTGGAPHLRSPALDLPFYQKMYLDLAALVLAVLISLRYCFKLILGCLCGKQKSVDSKKKNK